MPAAATTLLPNWLSSQSSVLELAQPMGRWLSLLNPIAPSPRLAARSTASSQRLPGEFTCIDTPEQSYDSFSAWIAGCLTREVGDEALAQALAERIESGFRGRDWSGQSVEPTLAENFPAARLGDRLLFIITDEVAEAAGINGEVLATRWLNQLRLVLGDQPLTLLDSQYAMHGLKPTGDNLRGDASWYGPYFHGRLTATGEIYNQDMFTAAHKELPFDTYLKITNLLTGDQLVVRINDRGPYVGDRMLDLSLGAATYLGAKDTGVVPIRAEVLEPADPLQVQLPDFDREQALQRPLITMRRP
ncbi:MAG: septal ring lytic transglycosylase RlpA family protein [Synechococcales cyanobacterium RM1_1_8]|nr:septal ring lytic transglycosylase RlpA family protein [Synechococcales cyanobacterium RM1_1_8]